ncbi:MAG: YebC/PmpR family DNA-binding transcriptional regulator [Myxococcota bacterium]|nr:YebC/PmpR family DNA-binding transcriptional regulator [Myxococcota bacterium]
MGRMFEKRKATMFKRWDRMAKAFTRCGKEITIAVKAGGPIPENNPALRRAIQNARSVNMPKDKIENAIKKASGDDASDYAILIYEGYAPHGVAILVETATDNPTRTVANVRMHFKKGGGNMGATGSVSFLFEHQGLFHLALDADRDWEELELELIDHGLESMAEDENEEGEKVMALRCAFEDFNNLSTALDELGIEPLKSETDYNPTTMTELSDEQADEVLALIDRLEQDDDVQRVFNTLP